MFLVFEATEKEQAMRYMKSFLVAVPVALGLLITPVITPAAHAEWRHGGWGYHGGYRGGWGVPLGAALLGLGVGAAVVASQPPAYYYPPAPAYYYPPPAYAQPYYSPYYAAPAPTYGQQ
jgi:hypothetical protein